MRGVPRAHGRINRMTLCCIYLDTWAGRAPSPNRAAVLVGDNQHAVIPAPMLPIYRCKFLAIDLNDVWPGVTVNASRQSALFNVDRHRRVARYLLNDGRRQVRSHGTIRRNHWRIASQYQQISVKSPSGLERDINGTRLPQNSRT